MNKQNATEVATRVTYTGAGSVGVPFAVQDGVSVAGGAGVGGACVSEKTRQGHQGRQGQEIRYQPPSLCP